MEKRICTFSVQTALLILEFNLVSLLSVTRVHCSNASLDKEGPIHDVSWSPNSKEFGVVYGFMPAKTTVFSERAQALHNFNIGPYNTILFSPHGRFVLVAGFGNLAGQMDIYDLEKDYTKVATIKASNASVCEWSPDGKHILTATTSPRLRVDNGIRIWHVSGGVMYNEDMTELYHVVWRPQSEISHSLENPLHPAPTPHPSALAYLGTVKAPSKPAGAYRPPGARGTSTPLHFKREDEGGAAYSNEGGSSHTFGTNGFGKPRRREVPGAEAAEPLPPGAAPGGGVSLTMAGDGEEALSKAALKNKKKREARKAKEAAGLSIGTADGEAAGGANRAYSPDRRNRYTHERSRSKGNIDKRGASRGRNPSHNRMKPNYQPQVGPASNEDPKKPTIVPPPAPAPDAVAAGAAPDLMVTSPGGGGGAHEKKVRSLLKKMRAIEDLKMRQATGEKLEDTQVKKIGTEQAIKKELEALDALP